MPPGMGVSTLRRAASILRVLGIAAIGACSAPASAQPVTLDAAPPVAIDDEPPSRPPDAVRIRMQDHFDELRAIERMLLRGDLEDARDAALAITFDRPERDLPVWAVHIARMQGAATALARSTTLEQACRSETRLAVACAACHRASNAMPTFAVDPEPADDGSASARMRRHLWATDRLWEGLIGLSDDAWRAGAVLIATAPDAPGEGIDAERMRRYALPLRTAARRARIATTPDARARAYADLLIVCTGCHAQGRE